jgi:hypothetical protein
MYFIALSILGRNGTSCAAGSMTRETAANRHRFEKNCDSPPDRGPLPGPVAAIHVFNAPLNNEKDVGGRDKPDHGSLAFR